MRTPAECAELHDKNIELNVSLLDQRFLTGDRALYARLLERLPRFIHSQRDSLVRNLSRWGIRRACGFVAVAPLSGQRAVRADLLRSLEPAARFGLEVGLTIDAVRQGARVVEVPVALDHRHTGRRLSGFAHRGRQGTDVVRALWPRLSSAHPARS